MRPTLALLLAAAACAERPPSAAERLALRRAVLRLPDAPLPVAEAMRAMEARGYEARLDEGRIGLDDVLRIENLLERARGGGVPPEAFGPAREAARRLALRLAAGEDTAPAVEALRTACAACHVKHREPR